MAGNKNDSSSTRGNVTIRVLAASTGVTYRVSLYPSELTVANIRGHLAAAVPSSDQILLLGPPYKVPRDSTLQSDEVLNSLRLGDVEDEPVADDQLLRQQNPTQQRWNSTGDSDGIKIIPSKILHTSSSDRSGARRLFLFSKQSLSENSPDPPPCHLEPLDLVLPTEAPGPSPLSIDPSSSPPLHQALAAYERQFMLYLSQGRVLADGADLRLAATRACVKEQAVMARALRSAVSNLSDHYHGAARTRAEFTASFQAETTRHSSILQKFESVLNNLATIPLHPTLQSIARTSGRPMSTLLDTVPVEGEKAWAQQCQNAHQRLLSLFQELDSAFRELGNPTTRQEEAKQDILAEEEIENMWQQVETVARVCTIRQAQRLEKLTMDHQEVVRIITTALGTDNDDEVQNAFTPLREISNTSKVIVPLMLTDDHTMKELMIKVADAKTRAMKRMKVRLRDISIAQSSIQRCLSSVNVLGDALSHQTQNMIHLEHVVELPQSYRSFLSELRRRRAYGAAVISLSTAMMERLTMMRSDEVKAREKFLRGPGKHLMPAFFETFVPTLATPPPVFSPQVPAMVELDTLPDVGEETLTGESSLDAVMQPEREHGGSTSTLTAESGNPHQRATQQTSLRNQDSGCVQQRYTPQQEQQQQNQDQLIVSADEPADITLDTSVSAATEAVTKAELKTLAYENSMLRQELERLGGKPPHTYVELRDIISKTYDIDVTSLRKELEEAKEQARLAKMALDSYSTQKNSSDKISHSSFNVGDVGLFMPAGRGLGGKRTYVAFHTNCPYRYLSTDCVEGSPDFVLGRVVFQEERIAGEIGTDTNPFGLHPGTTFWVLTVEVIVPKKK